MSIEADDIVDDLPSLTPKQHAFVRALLKGKTASDAYREAYDCEGMAANSIWVAASRLRSDAKVALWLRHYQLAAVQEGAVTLKGHLGELTRLREHALDAKQVAAAVQAEHHRGRAAGLLRIGCELRTRRVMRSCSKLSKDYWARKQPKRLELPWATLARRQAEPRTYPGAYYALTRRADEPVSSSCNWHFGCRTHDCLSDDRN